MSTASSLVELQEAGARRARPIAQAPGRRLGELALLAVVGGCQLAWLSAICYGIFLLST
jgi:hypothetical protein